MSPHSIVLGGALSGDCSHRTCIVGPQILLIITMRAASKTTNIRVEKTLQVSFTKVLDNNNTVRFFLMIFMTCCINDIHDPPPVSACFLTSGLCRSVSVEHQME